jgi:putative protease
LYREQLDKIKDGSPFVSTRDVESLAQTFGRGGSFTSGYFKKTGGADMMSIKTPKSTGAYAGSVVKISPEGRCVIKTERELIPGDGVEIAAKTSVGTFINRLCRPGEKFFVDLPKASDARVGDKVFRTYDKKLNDELKRFYSRDVKKTPVTCSVTALADRPLEITLKNDRVSVTVMGGLVSAAVNRPMGGEILERVGKIGNYPFKPAFKDCHTGDDVFISVGQINELKRTAADRFAQALLDSYKKTSVLDAVFDVSPRLPLARKSINVQIDSLNLFDGVLLDGVDVIYAEADDIIKRGGGELSAKARKNGSRLFAALPAFAESARTEELVRRLRADGIDGFLARTLGQLSTLKFLRKRLEGGSDLFEKQTAADYGLNIFNGHALAFILNFAHTACLSTELSFEDSALFANEYCEIIVHGRTPLMTTKQCPAGLYDGGKDGQYCAARYSGDSYTLLDRKGAVLPVKRDCDACVAYILNEKTLCALDRQRKPALSPAGAFRICLTTETEAQARDIVGAYVLAAERGFSDESPKTHFLEIYGDDATTGGRLFSGVY